MSIQIVSQNELQKNGYIVSTGAGNYLSPSEDITTLYGPGYPIAPVTRPEDNDAPRSIDYPVGINYTLQPRIGYGLMPAAALDATYNSVTEVANPVNLILRVLAGFTKQLKDPKSGKRLKDGHPYQWIIEEPDPLHHIPFNVWMSWFKKSSKKYAAPAFHYHRTNGQIDSLEYIDGSTLFLITNSHGYLPEPDEFDPEVMKIIRAASAGNNWQNFEFSKLTKQWLAKVEKWQKQGKPLPVTTPAFVQVIKGTPFSFWDKNQIYFMPEPPSMITNSPYSETYIERAWTPINVIALMWAFHLGYYRTGNTPEGLLEVPMSMFPTLPKIAQFEREFNNRQATGTTTMMSRTRVVPQGTKYTNTKRPDFPKDLYQQATTLIMYALGVPPSAMGQKASLGIGSSSKGMEQGAAHDLTTQIIENERISMQDAINTALTKAGVDDATFFMDYPQEEIDPQIQAQQLTQEWEMGQATLNDILTAQDLEPIGDPDDLEGNAANFHIRIVGQTAYAVEKMKFDPKSGALLTPAPVAGGSPENRSPFNPNDPGAAAAEQDGKENLPPNPKTAQKILKSIEESGGKSFSLSGVTYSLPTITKELGADAGYDGYSLGARQPAAPDGVMQQEFELGMKEEQEHAGTVHGDQAVIRNIVLDHLKEDPQYYTHLRRSQIDKMFGIVDEDDWGPDGPPSDDLIKRYKLIGNRVVNEETGQTVPGGDHKTHAEAVDHLRALYANVPDASKSDISKGLQRIADKRALIKVSDEYFKHCGVCPEDKAYFGAPVSNDLHFDFDALHEGHQSDIDVVAMTPKDLPPQPALWFPAGADKLAIAQKIGGPQYKRREAAWLLDQSLGFHLVPLAYTAQVNDEDGCVTWYTVGRMDTNPKPVNEYDPVWTERAGIFDFITADQDRPSNKNFLSHPDDPARVILIDNAFSFPVDSNMAAKSAFTDSIINKDISPETLKAVKMARGDAAMWSDAKDLLGVQATENAQNRIDLLLKEKKITSDMVAEKSTV